MKTLDIPMSVLKTTYENDRSIINHRKIKDSPNRFSIFFTLDENAVNRSKQEFNRTFGTVSDGSVIDIGSIDPYFKIVSDIILDRNFVTGEPFDLIKATRIEYPAFQLFINGKKIPDEVIKVYCTESHTDIFVPLARVNNYKAMDVLIESNTTAGKEYICKRFPYGTSRNFSIDLTEIDAKLYSFDKLKKEGFFIYNNGYLTHSDYSFEYIADRKIINITTEEAMVGEVEIYYNHDIKYRMQKVENAEIYRLVYDLGKYMNPIYGAVPKQSCHFYINGEKIPSNLIEQIGRTHYLMDLQGNTPLSYFTVAVSDLDILADKKYLVMGSDYYLHKMIGYERLTKYFNTGNTDSNFDKYNVNIHSAMNGNGAFYKENIIENRIKYLEKSSDAPNIKIKEEIKKNPYILRTFLKNYSKVTRNYILNKNNARNPTEIRIGSDTKLTPTERLYYNVYVNRKFLPHDMYTIDEDFVLHLPVTSLPEENNLVEIDEIKIDTNKNGIRYKAYLPNDLSNIYMNDDENGIKADLIIHKSEISNWYEQLSDIIILERISNLNSLLFPSEKNIGYTYLNDTIIEEDEDNIIIKFKTAPKNKFLVYFKNFSYISTFINKTESQDFNSNLIFLYENGKSDPIPVIPKSLPEVYVNGELYINDVDYIYSTPETNNKVAGTLLSFIRKIEKDDVISITFDEIDNRSLVSSINTKYQSKYGLLYLGDLPFPYHPDYVDLYIDGKKVFVSDIELLSDKLIRIKDISVPFKDIYAKTKFSVDYSLLEEFFDTYREYESEFEKQIGSLFGGVDFTRDNSHASAIPDEVYESFEDDVGQSGNNVKDENPKTEEEEIERASLLTTIFFNWLASDDARAHIDMGNNADSEVLDYFSLYDLSSNVGDRRDIVVDLNEKCISGSNIIFNMNQEPLTDAKKLKMITEALMKGHKEVQLDNLYNEYLKNPISNVILPYDFPFSKEKRRYKYWVFEDPNDEVITLYENQSLFGEYNPENHITHFPDKYKYKGE